MENKNENKKSKLIFDILEAKALLRRGMKVVDCKPLNTDRSKTVLVFENTPEFRQALSEIRNLCKLNIDTKDIIDPRVARALLKRGMQMVDCRLSDIDKSRMIFTFANTEVFQINLNEIMDEIQAKKDTETKSEQPTIALD